MKKFKWYILLLSAMIWGSSQLKAQNDQPDSKCLFWRQCTENVIMLYLDPKPFEEFAGKDIKVKLYDGKAWVMVVIQDCRNNFFDSEDVGPAQEIHMWLSIEGSHDNEILPVFGAEKTLNTMSWYYLYNGSTNPKARKYYGDSGILSEPVEKLSMSYTPSLLSGQFIVNQTMSFSWNAVPKEPAAKKLGINFEIFKRDSSGKIILTKVQALLLVKSWFAPGTLEVKGGIDSNKFVGPGTYQVFINSYNPILARGMLGVEISK
jgi:hypothetical protein